MPPKESLAKRLLEVLPPIIQHLRGRAKSAGRSNVTMAQFRILAHINQGLLTVGSLAKNQLVAQPTMSKMVDGLVKRGLIRRKSDVHDRRQINLELTAKGKMILSSGMGTIETRLTSDFQNLSSEDKKDLQNSLEGLERVFRKLRA